MKYHALDSTPSRIADDVAQHPAKAGPYSRSGGGAVDGARQRPGEWVRNHAHNVAERTSNFFRPMQMFAGDIRSGFGRGNTQGLGNAASIQFAQGAFPNNTLLGQGSNIPMAQVLPSAPPANVYEKPYSAHPYPASGAQGMPVAPIAVLPLPGFQSTPVPTGLITYF